MTGRNPIALCRLGAERPQEEGWHEPYEPRGSRAVGRARERCWNDDWVLDLDIKGFFDNLDHELLMKAVRKHTGRKWVLLYLERWLKAPAQQPDGTLGRGSESTTGQSVFALCLGRLDEEQIPWSPI